MIKKKDRRKRKQGEATVSAIKKEKREEKAGERGAIFFFGILISSKKAKERN